MARRTKNQRARTLIQSHEESVAQRALDALQEREALKAWWASHDERRRVLRVLELVSGLSRAEITAALGRRNTITDLEFRPMSEVEKRILRPASGRPRGRPRRELDRAGVVAALRACGGSLRSAAAKIGVPRTTLQRYVVAARVPPTMHVYGAELRDEHVEMLSREGISPHVAASRGYASVAKGLKIPIWTAQGEIAWSQVRLDQPKNSQRRYQNDPGFWATVDVPPAGRDLVLDGMRRLYVTESPRKADAAVSAGLACVAVCGAELLPLEASDWEAFDLKARDVVIVFDADGARNPRVGDAEQRLRQLLTKCGARVRVVRLPESAGRPKTGLDDYLAAGHSEADLLALPLAREPGE